MAINKGKRKGAVERTEPLARSNVRHAPVWFVWGASLAFVSAGLSVLFMWQPWYPYTHGAQMAKATALNRFGQNEPTPSFDFYAKLPSQTISQPTPIVDDVALAPNPSEMDTAPTAAPPTTGYYLQLGVVSDYEQANKMLMDGLIAGAPTKAMAHKTPAGQVYKVYVGPLASYQQAIAYQRNLLKNSITTTLSSSIP